MLLSLLLFLLGLSVGTLGTLIGVSGGFIHVPVMIFAANQIFMYNVD